MSQLTAPKMPLTASNPFLLCGDEGEEDIVSYLIHIFEVFYYPQRLCHQWNKPKQPSS